MLPGNTHPKDPKAKLEKETKSRKRTRRLDTHAMTASA